MACILLVDDERDQLEIRALLVERAGHQVLCAATPAEALRQFDSAKVDAICMDLRLPTPDDGKALIRSFRERSPEVRVLVLSGWTDELKGSPEADMIQGVLQKPIRSERLLALLGRTAALVLALFVPAMFAAPHRFHMAREGEAVAEITMHAPGADWGREGKEASVAEIWVDGSHRSDVVVVGERRPGRYGILLGRLGPGEHEVEVRRSSAHSAAGIPLEVAGIDVRPYYPDSAGHRIAAHAPFVHARANTAGRFTDVPLFSYCERTGPAGSDCLQYTVIFSNEDGGTSTRALMARWGRTTDIEHVYRVCFDRTGVVSSAIIQTHDHKEVPFEGRREGHHPVLSVVTDNNMVAAAGAESPLRFHLAPVFVDLSGKSRESAMDDQPWSYGVMAAELEREGKLRPAGAVDGQKISHPRNYLYLEAEIGNRQSRLAAQVRLDGENVWRSAHLGRADYAIERSGWIRTAIELPPGTAARQVAEIGFECLTEDNTKLAGECDLRQVSRAFFLDGGYAPGPAFWNLPAGERRFPSGQTLTFRVDQ